MDDFEQSEGWCKVDEKVKDKLLEDLVTLLNCSICKEIMCCPVVHPCGHSFCCTCIRTWHQRHNACPVCNRRQTKFPPINTTLRDVSQQIINSCDEYIKDERVRLYLQKRPKVKSTNKNDPSIKESTDPSSAEENNPSNFKKFCRLFRFTRKQEAAESYENTDNRFEDVAIYGQAAAAAEN